MFKHIITTLLQNNNILFLPLALVQKLHALPRTRTRLLPASAFEWSQWDGEGSNCSLHSTVLQTKNNDVTASLKTARNSSAFLKSFSVRGLMHPQPHADGVIVVGLPPNAF
jgi:hypothetical protein